MAKAPDDLEAVRAVTSALSGFSPEEQERVIRWAREKLGLAAAPRTSPEETIPQPPVQPKPIEQGDRAQPPGTPKDLKTFVSSKNPKSDVQFAATVAYFYRFEASPEQRRTEIDAAALQNACRLAARQRLKHPGMTLTNAKNQGFLDKGSDTGKFAINSVGENLVAMTLPSQSGRVTKGGGKHKKPKKPTRKKK